MTRISDAIGAGDPSIYLVKIPKICAKLALQYILGNKVTVLLIRGANMDI